MLGVIPCHGGKGSAAAGKDTRRRAEVVHETYSARTGVPLRAVRLGEATTCIYREDIMLAVER